MIMNEFLLTFSLIILVTTFLVTGISLIVILVRDINSVNKEIKKLNKELKN